MRSVWTRIHFMCALGLGAFGLVSPVKLRGSEEKKKRPNVLFIAIDDLRTSQSIGKVFRLNPNGKYWIRRRQRRK